MPAYVTVATDRNLGTPPTAYPCRATIVWPNGVEDEQEQVGKQVTTPPTLTQFRAKPAVFYCETCEEMPSGFVYKFRPTGQTFTYSNQYQLSNIQMISAKGITSFDMDISQCVNLQNVSIGTVLNDVSISGPMPWGSDTSNTSAAITRIPIFATIFPATNYPINQGSPYAIFSFRNNVVNCNFNPIFQNQPTNYRKWFFDFQFNAQEFLDIDCAGFRNITIRNNTSLIEITLNSLSGLSYVDNSIINLDLSLNNIDTFKLNGLSGITTINSGLKLVINLKYNNIGSKGPLPNNTINSFPTSLSTDINFQSNKFINWSTIYSGANLNTLSLSNQLPGLSNVEWSSTLNSPFKQFDFSNNLLTSCPPISAGTRYLDIRNNNIVSNGVNNPEISDGLCLPNFVPGMTHFYGGSTVGSGKLNNYGRWTPNNGDQYNTPLDNITTWQVFDIQYSLLNEGTFNFQFSSTMSNTGATINLSNNLYTTFDLSKLGGFRNIYLSNNQLLNVTNLKNLTQPELIDLNVNSNLGQGNSTSDVLISNADTWPPTLRKLILGRNKIETWKKSFVNFATNPPNAVLDFNWYPGYNSPTVPLIVQNSVSFIIRDIITGTTKTLGILDLSSAYNSGVGGAITGPSTNALRYPLSSQSSQTLGCLNCLTASTSTPCTVAGLTNLTSFGRGFTVRLLYV
jgi:hypothetical protein